MNGQLLLNILCALSLVGVPVVTAHTVIEEQTKVEQAVEQVTPEPTEKASSDAPETPKELESTNEVSEPEQAPQTVSTTQSATTSETYTKKTTAPNTPRPSEDAPIWEQFNAHGAALTDTAREFYYELKYNRERTCLADREPLPAPFDNEFFTIMPLIGLERANQFFNEEGYKDDVKVAWEVYIMNQNIPERHYMGNARVIGDGAQYPIAQYYPSISDYNNQIKFYMNYGNMTVDWEVPGNICPVSDQQRVEADDLAAKMTAFLKEINAKYHAVCPRG